MKLSEKITYCRQKAGLSQEALANILGVSRQAVSKWETEAAVPEIDKLPLLSKTFDVTIDWLLSEEEPLQDISKSHQEKNIETPMVKRFGYGRLPAFLSTSVKKYGWLAGVYLALEGCLSVVVGYIGLMIFRFLLTVWVELLDSSSKFHPLYLLYAFPLSALILGVAAIVGGIYLAVNLKKNKTNQIQ